MTFNIFIHLYTVMISIGRCDSDRVLYSTNRNAYMVKVDNGILIIGEFWLECVFLCGKCLSCGMLPSRIWQMFSELLNSLQYIGNRLEMPLYNTWLVCFNSAIRPVLEPQYEMFRSYFGLESPSTSSHLPWYYTLFFSAVSNICKRTICARNVLI